MDLSAQHAGFVIVAYAASALALAVLVIRICLRDRALRRQIDQSTDHS
jgi:heme exporter protein CcmD